MGLFQLFLQEFSKKIPPKIRYNFSKTLPEFFLRFSLWKLLQEFLRKFMLVSGNHFKDSQTSSRTIPEITLKNLPRIQLGIPPVRRFLPVCCFQNI